MDELELLKKTGRRTTGNLNRFLNKKSTYVAQKFVFYCKMDIDSKYFRIYCIEWYKFDY